MEQPSAGEDAPKSQVNRERDAPFVILDPPQQAAPELVCPNCDYSLAGLTEDRCPECGQPFDRAKLIRWHTEPSLPLPLGRPEPPPLRESIFYLTLSAPARLGRGLPPRPDVEASREFSLPPRALATIVFCIFIICLSGGNAGSVALYSAFLLPLASCLCEAALARILIRCVRPRAVPDHCRASFWGVLCRCFAGHLLLTVGGMVAVALALAATGWESYTPLLGLFGVPVLTTLYWSFCVGTAVRARGIESPGRTLAILLIPVCGAGAIFLFIAPWLIIGLIL